MSSIDRIETTIRSEVDRLDAEIKDIRERAAAAQYEDLWEGLVQRAEDLARERETIQNLLETLSVRRG